MKKEHVKKIVVPIIVLCLIGAVWLIKDMGKNDLSSPDNSSNDIETTNSKQTDNNPDFELHVTEEIDLEKLKSYGLPIIIDFGADTCAPCRRMAPIIKELNESLRGRAIIKYVDVANYGSLAQNYPVEVIPTQIFIDKTGEPFKPEDPLAMKMILYQNKNTNEHVLTAHKGYMDKIELLAALKEMGLEDE